MGTAFVITRIRFPCGRLSVLILSPVPMLPLRSLLPLSPTIRNALKPHTAKNALKGIGRAYTTGPPPMPKWNPYPTRGLAAKVWYRPDGRPRSKLKGAVIGELLQIEQWDPFLTMGIVLPVVLSTFAVLMWNSALELIDHHERELFLLAYITLAQQVDRTYSQHDFESLDSTKEYFYKLCRALPQDRVEEDIDGRVERFIRLIEETIEAASTFQRHSDDGSRPSDPNTRPPPPPNAQNPANPAAGYLSQVKSNDPALSALFASPDPDPLQALHAIMRAYARDMHRILEHGLRKGTVVACAEAALDGFENTVAAIGLVSQRVGVLKEEEWSANGIFLKSGKESESKEKDEYESIG